MTKSDECALGLNKARSTFLECSLNNFTFRSNRPETEKSRNRSRKKKKPETKPVFSNPCLEGCLAAAKSDHGLLIRDLIVVSTNATIHQKSLATFEKNVGHQFVSKSHRDFESN